MNKKDYILNKNKYPYHYNATWFISIDNKIEQILDFEYIAYMLENHPISWFWEIQKYYQNKFMVDYVVLHRINYENFKY